MQLLAFLICDEIKELPNGGLDLLKAGIFSVPMPPPDGAGYQFQILIRFMPDPADLGSRTLTMYYRNDDGQDIMPPFQKTVDVRQETINEYRINMKAYIPGPGQYSFDLFLDEQFVASHPLEVVQ